MHVLYFFVILIAFLLINDWIKIQCRRNKNGRKKLEENERKREMLMRIYSLDIGEDVDEETLEKLAKEERMLLRTLGYQLVGEEGGEKR